MNYWVAIRPDDLSAVFVGEELTALTRPEASAAVQDAIDDVTAIVRDAVAQNLANLLPDGALIPRSLRPAALDMIAWRLLKRYALAITDERKQAAAEAAARIAEVRTQKQLVLDATGKLPVQPAGTPAIIAPDPAYGNDGPGLYPLPK